MKKIIFLRTTVLILGIFLVAFGIWHKELLNVLGKGIVICLECIGIG